jgi:NMD protein affecting ribosome stability and mRNA decay
MTRSTHANAGRRIAGRAQQDHLLDPYHPQLKPHEPTRCPQCNALYQHGRWQWAAAPVEAREELCPACRRTNDGLPAGIVTVHRPLPKQRDEILALARHREEAEKAEHPLNRIMGIEEQADALTITTTDIHLARRLGEAIKRAFHGELAMHYDDASYFVRVDWRPSR